MIKTMCKENNYIKIPVSTESVQVLDPTLHQHSPINMASQIELHFPDSEENPDLLVLLRLSLHLSPNKQKSWDC